MNLFFIILFLIIIQIIIISFIRLIYQYYYDYGTYKIIYNDKDIEYINKYYNNSRIINLNRKKKKKYVTIIAFNIPSTMYDIFSNYYYWLSNNYDKSVIINHREYKNNNEYFYMMKYDTNVKVQNEILKIKNLKYELIDDQYKDEIRDDWDEELWYYIHNRLYQQKKRGDKEIDIRENDKTKIYIRDEILPDIDLDEYEMIGKIYVKDIYMFICNYQKYIQNHYLRYLLINTDKHILIYHTNKNDKYFGSGEWDETVDFLNSIRLIRWKYGNTKNGYNVLGQIIMLIREIIKDSENKILRQDTGFMVYCDFFIEMCKKYDYHIFKDD